MLDRFIDVKLDRARPAELARKARERVREVRGGGIERLWTIEVDALARTHAALGRAPEGVPLLSRVVDAAERIVGRRLEAATIPPIAEYDTLNAKDVRAKLREIGRLDLAKVRRYEAAHKNRKSVVEEVEREIGRRVRVGTAPPEAAEAAPADPVQAEAVSGASAPAEAVGETTSPAQAQASPAAT